ncbi:hypothetical protein ATEIFO6365_0013029200 [Aspergillus terreus]|uniref:Uncharacterized protein n=1 Tax=Aspergillus terreus TaxID=33178 RepID=A0A5M3ZFM2_ASPTE|nr:hypothetical protein ATETN484_0014029200 [Aspergillus terreus]GFF20958.1 hypothetical protein ATEIFO6365_0013029200 [Aspergillus terreus]
MPTKKSQYNPPFNQLKILREKIWPLLTLDQISDHDLAPYGIVREEFDIEAPDTVLGDKLPILFTPLSQKVLDKHPINKKALGFDHGDFKYREEFSTDKWLLQLLREGSLGQEKFTTRAEEAARYLQRWAWHGFTRVGFPTSVPDRECPAVCLSQALNWHEIELVSVSPSVLLNRVSNIRNM